MGPGRAPWPRVGVQRGEAEAPLPPTRASAETQLHPPAGTHAEPARGRSCSPAEVRGGTGRRRDANENGAGKAARSDRRRWGTARSPRAWVSRGRGCGRSWGSWPRRRSGTELLQPCGTRQRRAGAYPGSSYRCRGVSGDLRARSRRHCGDSSRTIKPPGAGAEPGARAAFHAPRVNGGSCLGAPRALGRVGPPIPAAPVTHTRSGPVLRSQDWEPTRGQLRTGESVYCRGNLRFRPFDPKISSRLRGLRSSSPHSCDELLGAQRAVGEQRARLPRRFSLCRATMQRVL